ncbi:glycosyltransferase family 4 protein [Enterococcus timonensis]|uniref:glycosyltransferase family 4 protein n=1 Tax=Enterococcus timonensis TaxID=1852364 RepID=UPI0008D9B0FB|nr:glycosyltransferase family 4 protein [Enterococcus timonensis]
MKIGLFTDTYFPQVSGVATSIKTLKEALESRGHQVYIFTTTDPNVLEQEKDIIRMPSVPFVSFKDRRIVVRGMLSAYYIAKELGLEMIHTQTEFGCGILGKMVAHQMKIPCVHTYHTMYEDYLHYIAKGKIFRPSHVKLLSRFFSHHLSGLVCPSMRVVETLQKYGVSTPLRVIPTGINLQKFSKDQVEEAAIVELRQRYGYTKDTILLLSLSRLSYEKNIQEVLHGFTEIIKEIPEARLLIAGNGPYVEELNELTQKLGLEDVVTFAGEVNQEIVPVYYRAADYFVSCSTSESQGLTYTEAMASSTQCVVCGNEYIDSLFDHPSFGQTFKQPEEFAESFLSYYQSKQIKDSQLLAEKLYSLSSEKFAEDILEFYDAAQNYFDMTLATEESYPTRILKTRKILRRKEQ